MYDKDNLKKDRFVLNSVSMYTFHHGCAGLWQKCLQSWKRDDECGGSAHSLLLIQSRTLHGMVLPIFKVSLPISINLIYIIPPRHACPEKFNSARSSYPDNQYWSSQFLLYPKLLWAVLCCFFLYCCIILKAGNIEELISIFAYVDLFMYVQLYICMCLGKEALLYAFMW